MGKLRWYRCDPNDALEGMAELTIEERGAYITVLNLIYTHDGAVDDDPRLIAGWLRSDVRVWNRIRTKLLERKKLYVVGNSLRNERADREVDDALHRIATAAQAGLKSAASRADEKRILKHLATTYDQSTAQLPTITNTEKSLSFIKLNLGAQTEPADLPKAFQGKRPADLSRSELNDAIKLRRARRNQEGEA